MGKNIIPVLAFFLIALVAFLAFQVIGVITDNPLPAATQKQIQPLNPTLNTNVISDLKKAVQN